VTLEDILQNKGAVASLIDHTLLKPEATQLEIHRLCDDARANNFASVCINPHWVQTAVKRLRESDIRVCTVIGFPLGANDARTKLAEANVALIHGAEELDMVQNIGALRSGDFHLVHKEIADLADVAHSRGAILKVILETCLLTDAEKRTACQLAVQAKADFVKTSTGFSKSGATVADVKLMRQTVGPEMGVKAAGGIRTFEALREMVLAGASRIGTSSGISILYEMEQAVPSPASETGAY
jgi:deoxyribose-phosphate aldolase